MKNLTRRRPDGRFLLPILGLCLLSALPGAAQAQRDDLGELRAEEARRQADHVAVRVLGRARDVRDDGRRFIVETAGMRFLVEYDRGGLAGFGLRSPSLREGDRVVVYGRLVSGERILSDRIVAVGPGEGSVEGRRVTGVIRSVDRRRNRFTARESDGSQFEVRYTDQTVLARLGRRATPEDLREGDAIWAEGRWDGRDILLASRVEITAAASGWRDGEIGRVESISARDESFQARFGRESRRVDTRGAQFWLGGRRVAGGSLRPGMTVRVYGDERGATIRATRVVIDDSLTPDGPATSRLEGRIRQVDPGAQTIFLTPESSSGLYTRIYVPGNATVERFGRRVGLRELQTGDRIRARGSERDGRFTAEFVEVLR
jgi:cytochrome c-type biogenesis protein CcmE